MINVGILGSTGRVGSLLIDDLANDEQARVAAVHVFDKLTRQVPDGTVVTNDMKVLLDSSDVVIDFSAPAATEALLTQVVENGEGKPLVIFPRGYELSNDEDTIRHDIIRLIATIQNSVEDMKVLL